MKRLLGLLAIAIAANAVAYDPLTAENRAQYSMETALLRLLPPEQFLVQVDATVGARTNRRPTESEVFENEPATTVTAPAPMPGFVGEPETSSATRPPGTRRYYQYSETPVLEALRVHIALDTEVSRETETLVRRLVDAQLVTYRCKASVEYSKIPMRKSERSVAAAVAEIPSALPGFRVDEWLGTILGIAFFLSLVAVFLLWRLVAQARRRHLEMPARARRPVVAPVAAEAPAAKTAVAAAAMPETTSEAVLASLLRRQLLDRFLRRSEAFRLYYLRLADSVRTELCGLMRGPAFEALLESLELMMLSGATKIETSDEVEHLRFHEKSFEDFVAEETWQTGRLFGFLHQLTDDQLLSVANRETPLTTCLMLRFLKPQTAASILNSLGTNRRREVLAESSRVSATSFEKIAEIEQHLRESVQSTPDRMFGAREKDVAFWGEVVARTEDPKSLLEDIRVVRPDLFPALKRFRVKLEDLGSFPEDVVRRVLSDADNELLALALMTVTKNVVNDVLERLSPRRQELVRAQMRAFSDVSPDRARAANQQLTVRLREAMG